MNENNLFMLIEYASNKSLDLYIDPRFGIGENAGSFVHFYIGCVLNGLEYMHSVNVDTYISYIYIICMWRVTIFGWWHLKCSMFAYVPVS